MGFWSSFKDFALPAAGAIIGGGLGSDYGDIGRIIGAGVGGAGGSALAGNDLSTIGLTGALSAGGSAALPYLADTLGINTSGLPFLDSSFGLPGADAGSSMGVLPGASDFSGPSANGIGTSSDWDGSDLLTQDNQPWNQPLNLGGENSNQLNYMTSDLGLNNTPDALGAPSGLPTTSTSALPTGDMSGFDGITPGAKPDAPNQLSQLISKLGLGKEQILPGLALAYNGYKSGQETPEAKQLREQAEQAKSQGQALQNYIQTGTLPPGAQASVNQATAAAKARVRSDYASKNLSGSSMERDALNNIDLQSKAQAGQIAAQLLDTGIRESNMSSNIYNFLLRSQDQKDNELGQAIGRFAASSVPARQAA